MMKVVLRSGHWHPPLRMMRSAELELPMIPSNAMPIFLRYLRNRYQRPVLRPLTERRFLQLVKTQTNGQKMNLLEIPVKGGVSWIRRLGLINSLMTTLSTRTMRSIDVYFPSWYSHCLFIFVLHFINTAFFGWICPCQCLFCFYINGSCSLSSSATMSFRMGLDNHHAAWVKRK